MSSNPRYKNGHRRRQLRARFIAMGLPCAICGRPIHYDEPSDSRHPLSFVIDERVPVSRYKEGGFYNPTQAALDPDNVQPAHWICNSQKGARTMAELYKPRGYTQTGGTHYKKHPIPGGQHETEQDRQNIQGTPSAINLPDGDW